jgi:predicted Fe-Mo cluster-binding NifX family protein
MKVAITVWDKRISPVFDVCREALILEVDKGSVLSTATEKLDSASPFLKIQRLVGLGIETLICGAISEPVSRELTDRKVKVIGFVAGDIDEVIRAFLSKAFPTEALYMPGYCGQQRRFRGGQGPKRRRNRQRGKTVN